MTNSYVWDIPLKRIYTAPYFSQLASPPTPLWKRLSCIFTWICSPWRPLH